MYERFKLYCRSFKSGLSKVSSRRLLSFLFALSFILSCVFQAPLTRSAVSFSSKYVHIFPSSVSTISFRDDLLNSFSFDNFSTNEGSSSYMFSCRQLDSTQSNQDFRIFTSFNYPYTLDFATCLNSSASGQILCPGSSSIGALAVTFSVTLILPNSTNYVTLSKTAFFLPDRTYSVGFLKNSTNNSLNNIYQFNFFISSLSWFGNISNYIGSTIVSSEFAFSFTPSDSPALSTYDYSVGVSYIYSYSPSDVSVVVPGTSRTDESVSQFESANDDLMSEFDDYSNIEGSIQDGLSSAESALSETFSGWSWGSLAPSASFVSSTLLNLFNRLGDFQQLILYPLLAGVALVFLGRWGSVRSSKRAQTARQNPRSRGLGGS